MMRTFNLFLSLGLLLASTASFAQGAPPNDEGPAEESPESRRSFPKLVKSAQKAYATEDYDRAIRELVRAYSRRSNARLLFNIAKSYDKKGECASALVYYRAYVNHPANEKDLLSAAEKEMEKAGDCEQYSDDLAGRLVVDTTPPGATVSVDGEKRGTTPVEVVPLSPGSHQLSIEKEGYEPVDIKLELNSGKPRRISQILQEQTSPEPPSDPSESPERKSFFWPIHPAAIALGGAGVGGLALGGVYDWVLLPKTDDLRERAKDNGNSSRFRQLTDRRETEKTVALIGYVGGGLLLASGIAWHVVDVTTERAASASRTDPRRPIVTFGATPRSVQFEVQF